MLKKILPIIVVIVVIAVGFMFYKNQQNEVNNKTVNLSSNFSETGNLIKENENLSFLYEEPGKPALKVVLKFDDDSQCDLGRGKEVCPKDFGEDGERITVNGILEKDSVKVLELILEQQTEIANPSSTYCVEQGGTLDIRDFSYGQYGFCVFEDGSECEEWAFFRNECKKGENICKNICGDGSCQENVCLGSGCPCAETTESCPLDCKQ